MLYPQSNESVSEATHEASSVGTDRSSDAGPAGPSNAWSWTKYHSVNIRLSIPLIFRRYYLTILLGKERRNTARLKEERKAHPLVTRGNAVVLVLFGTLTGLAILALIQSVSVFVFHQIGISVLPQ